MYEEVKISEDFMSLVIFQYSFYEIHGLVVVGENIHPKIVILFMDGVEQKNFDGIYIDNDFMLKIVLC